MKILMTSDHIYPAFPSIKDDLKVSERNYKSSFSSRHIQDFIAKGLAELGHEIFYWLPKGKHLNVPNGIEIVNKLPPRIDLAHLLYCNVMDGPVEHLDLIKREQLPWIGVRHLVERGDRKTHRPNFENLVFVSKYAARTFGQTRFVYNGYDPEEYIYKKNKEEYFFFIASMNKAKQKGLFLALELAQKMGFPLLVAGNAPSIEMAGEITKLCKSYGAEYIGPIYGRQKAKLFASAKGVLFPSLLPESFGGVAVEAMMSGTPVITSNNGALPEIMHPNAGFVCDNLADYEAAIEKIEEIDPEACFDYGVNNFHYKLMAERYAAVYENQISKSKNLKTLDFI